MRIQSVILTCLLSVSLAFSSNAPAGLVAHLPGDGNAADATGNGHNGTLVNTDFATGVNGQAFRFDGFNDYVTIPGNSALEPSDISVAMWVNIAASSAGTRLLADSSHGTSGNAGGWALQLTGDNRVDFAYGSSMAFFPHISSSVALLTETFHHVAATLSGSDMRIYVDGVLAGENLAYPGSPLPSVKNNGNIRLGRHFSVNRQFTGLLDDVRIYDHALSQSEISALSGTSVPEPSSVALLGLAGCLCLRRRHRNRSAVTTFPFRGV